MSFQFRNMQAFIRNCIEPHVVALAGMSKSRFNDLLNRLLKMDAEHLKLLAAQNKHLEDEIAKLILLVNSKIDSVTTIEVGWIGIWPTYQIPSDATKWLQCDGSRYNQTVYPDLFNILKSASLPDFRGYVLRGEGGNSAALGVHQGGAIQNIVGSFGGHAIGWYGGFGYGPFYSWSSGDRGSGGNGIGTSWGFDASRAIATANETRMQNKAVQYWIRALK